MEIPGIGIVAYYFMAYFIILAINQAVHLVNPPPQKGPARPAMDIVSHTGFVALYFASSALFGLFYYQSFLDTEAFNRTMKVTLALIALSVIPLSLSGVDLEKPTAVRWVVPAAVVGITKFIV